MLPTVSTPPCVEPSCSNTLFKVVSTVISLDLPGQHRAAFSAVVPLLNCKIVGIVTSPLF